MNAPHGPVPLRPAQQVMRLARLGSFHATRLSFKRILLRRMQAERWVFDRPLWQVDAQGVGRAVYRARGPHRTYSLVAFAHDLPPEARSDRVIAEAWDATFALIDGEATPADLDRLSGHVPRQEAGRYTGRELSLSRANRSVRLFDHVVDCLAAGRQPDPARLDATGYLMRTTAVYGSAKFGLSDHAALCDRPELAPPFQAEMLSVYLIRWFTLDMVRHLAEARNPGAAPLAPGLARRLGVGNSTGLGMAPFLLTHPALIHAWIAARETALARVRSVPSADPAAVAAVRDLAARSARDAAAWRTDHPGQSGKLAALRRDLAALEAHLAGQPLDGAHVWDRLWRWGEGALSAEGQEMLLSLLLEPHGALIDDLADTLSIDEPALFPIDGQQTVAALRGQIARAFGWALSIDWDRAAETARLWYISAEKLEPRLAERAEAPLEPYEQPLAPGRDVAALAVALDTVPDAGTVAAFLAAAPEHRAAVRRVQRTARCPYGEIQDNTISAQLLPVDLLRCKLSFFGAGRFDPRSDRWVRVNLFAGAPLPPDLAAASEIDWVFPDG